MLAKETIRTRFAPSPTGELHLGGARTALFNYLIAKKNNGKFILRVEDTDKERSKEEYIVSQYNDLCWLGLKPDESIYDKGEYGPYQQTERLDIYQDYIQQLLTKKKAYYCFCSKEELVKEKEEYLAKTKKINYQYSRKCLKLSQIQVEKLLKEGKSYVIRFEVNQQKSYSFYDLIKQQVNVRGREIEDFVICRNNKVPLLNFAVVIDDHLMKITHILRGEEHLSNTTRQLIIYEALNWNPPQFGHLPIILNQEKQKLSKRNQEKDDYQMISQLRQKGYLSQAIINHLLFLGWHPGDTNGEQANKELFSLEESIKSFSLERLHTHSAVFSLDKLNWYNNHYIRNMDVEDFKKISWELIKEKYKLTRDKKEWTEKIALLFHDQLSYFQELINLSDYFFKWEYSEQDAQEDKLTVSEASKIKRLFTQIEEWSEENTRQMLKGIEKKNFPLIRKRITKKQKGPELPKIIYLLGKQEFFRRITNTKNSRS